MNPIQKFLILINELENRIVKGEICVEEIPVIRIRIKKLLSNLNEITSIGVKQIIIRLNTIDETLSKMS